ncbi:hypothetical protein HK102_012967, partial [Quaeritorhiza haematococci]
MRPPRHAGGPALPGQLARAPRALCAGDGRVPVAGGPRVPRIGHASRGPAGRPEGGDPRPERAAERTGRRMVRAGPPGRAVQPEGELRPPAGLPPDPKACRPGGPGGATRGRLRLFPDADQTDRPGFELRERDAVGLPRARRRGGCEVRGQGEEAMSTPRRKAGTTLALLVLAAGGLLGIAVGHWRSGPGPYIRRFEMKGDWLRAPGAPGYAGYFRLKLDLPGPVKHAWVAVAPMEGFEVCVNRNPCGRFYLWRPTRPFQTGLSEGGQLLNPAPAALALNFPREYQWSSHRNDWLP